MVRVFSYDFFSDSTTHEFRLFSLVRGQNSPTSFFGKLPQQPLVRPVDVYPREPAIRSPTNLRVLSSPRTQWELSLLHPPTHPNASYIFNLFWRRAHGMGASQRRVVWGTQSPHNARFQPWELLLIRRMGAVRSLSAGFVCQSKTTKPTVPRKTIRSPSPCSPMNPSLIPLFSRCDPLLSSPYPLTLTRASHPSISPAGSTPNPYQPSSHPHSLQWTHTSNSSPFSTNPRDAKFPQTTFLTPLRADTLTSPLMPRWMGAGSRALSVLFVKLSLRHHVPRAAIPFCAIPLALYLFVVLVSFG